MPAAAACLSCKLCVPELSHYRDFRKKYTNNDIKYPHNCKAACKQFTFSEACLADSEQQQYLRIFHRDDTHLCHSHHYLTLNTECRSHIPIKIFSHILCSKYFQYFVKVVSRV